MAFSTSASSLMRYRLMCDMAELQDKPYPNIKLHLVDISKACLVLSTERYHKLHLTIEFPTTYPLSAPKVTLQTGISHPNVFGEYICASILNTTEGYTPAYTLKGICIQLLSFFASESIQQDVGNRNVNLADFQRADSFSPQALAFECTECGFSKSSRPLQPHSRRGKKMANKISAQTASTCSDNRAEAMDIDEVVSSMTIRPPIDQIPDECLLEMINYLDFEDLISLSRSWSRVEHLIRKFDVIRCRELQCFVLKQTNRHQLLGVGVSVSRKGTIESEFDLLSNKAYNEMFIRASIHGIPFQHWLPLPISHSHWRSCRGMIDECLNQLSVRLRLPAGKSKITVLFAFMNDIVVRLNEDLKLENDPHNSQKRYRSGSTLRHASERAIESYFHLYHLLLCIATGPGRQNVVAAANQMIQSFLEGYRDKTHVPNLGHLLVALQISDVQVTIELRKAIITEAITRNVVWLLDGKGAGYAELGYLETDPVSHYRLEKTFQGSRTSYRLLMFSELFRRTARPETRGTVSRKSLDSICDGLFERHGAPPYGAAAELAGEVRRLQKIDTFPDFMREMGLKNVPAASVFTTTLRDTVRQSISKGYSREMSQAPLLRLRLIRDKEIDKEAAVKSVNDCKGNWKMSNSQLKMMETQIRQGIITFFPNRKQKKRNGRNQGRRR